ncbi:MAG: hypothetical protein M1126_06270 [Candidatus Thermoplasmatota archaeon]|jgi:hypothetical protein|nr:hypothetical protein [Candidatus Thermoplasmatota archaeon]
MFSRREREFLTAIVRSETADEGNRQEIVEAFPNPIYRRKLLWGVRQKATRASADWNLYLRAAQIEPRVLPEPSPSELPPLKPEALVALGRALRSRLKPERRSHRGARDDASGGTGRR